MRLFLKVSLALLVSVTGASAQPSLSGIVRDETGGALPGVTVEVRGAAATPVTAITDGSGCYQFDRLPAGRYQLTFTLINFASVTRRDVTVSSSAPTRIDVVMHLALSADVTVTGKTTFTNLADAEDPAGNLVGIASSASQGAITAQQLDARPVMRTGEVLETVPGVVISHAVRRELATALAIALIAGLSLALVAIVWSRHVPFGIVVGAAMTCAIVTAGFMGTIIPMVSKRLGFDPATTAGPFETAFQDVIGFSVFLWMATRLARWL